jgi:hypothetical protein
MVDKFQYVDTDTFPLDNVLAIFLYSSSHWTVSLGLQEENSLPYNTLSIQTLGKKIKTRLKPQSVLNSIVFLLSLGKI